MQKIDILTSLYETTRALGFEEGMERLQEEILVRARELIGYDHCALLLWDADERELFVSHALGFDDRHDEVSDLRLGLGEGLCGRVAERREAIRIGDVQEDERYVAGLEEARSDMAVPLVMENQLVGVINVESRQPDAFTAEHEKVLTVLGSQAALAIVAARAKHRLENQVRHLEILFRLSQLAWTQADFDEILESVLEEVQRILPSGECAVLLREPDSGSLVIRAHRGYRDDVRGLEITEDRGITGRCYRTGEPQIVGDVTGDPDYIPGVPDARSEIALPLTVDGEVIGVLNAESRQPDAYDESHLRTLSVVANQVAGVLYSTRLLEETQRLAVTDSLTGLKNRRSFFDHLERAIARGERYDERFGLLYADIDRFKRINDDHGHPAGDRALVALADEMTGAVRSSDLVARIGGEEFAILLLQVPPPDPADVAERVRRAVEELEIPVDGGDPVSLTVSVGVSTFPEHGGDGQELLDRADDALYRAKRQGRNRVAVAGTESG